LKKVTLTFVCFNEKGSFNLISQTNTSYIPVHYECDFKVITDEYYKGINVCIKPDMYTIIANSSGSMNTNAANNTDLNKFNEDYISYISQYGVNILFVEVKLNETIISNVSVKKCIRLDQCSMYQHVSYFSYLGDGIYDNGDCCQQTCDEVTFEGSEIVKCGTHGYDCRNPKVETSI